MTNKIYKLNANRTKNRKKWLQWVHVKFAMHLRACTKFLWFVGCRRRCCCRRRRHHQHRWERATFIAHTLIHNLSWVSSAQVWQSNKNKWRKIQSTQYINNKSSNKFFTRLCWPTNQLFIQINAASEDFTPIFSLFILCRCRCCFKSSSSSRFLTYNCIWLIHFLFRSLKAKFEIAHNVFSLVQLTCAKDKESRCENNRIMCAADVPCLPKSWFEVESTFFATCYQNSNIGTSSTIFTFAFRSFSLALTSI